MTPRKPGVSHPVRQAVEATPDDLHSTELPVQDPGDQEGTEGPPHATRGLDRVAGVDFRDPVAEDVSRRSRTAPFFHQHASADLKTAIQFYDKGEFANSPGGKLVGSIGPGLRGGNLDAIIAFLQLVGGSHRPRRSPAQSPRPRPAPPTFRPSLRFQSPTRPRPHKH